MESLDCVVIGAGIVGLAVARRLALAGREVVVLEAEAAIGTHTSSRNSEVIHAGIYYAPGSLKARLCVRGKTALYRYVEERGVAHRRVGKVLVAVLPTELEALDRFRRTAIANGVTDLVPLDTEAVRSLEPEIVGVAGLLSPSTGIIDSHGLLQALQGDLEALHGSVALSSPVVGGAVEDGGILLFVEGADPVAVRCTSVVNAAGLFAPRVARTLRGVSPASIPHEYFAAGHYFVLAARSPFTHLVYPMPVPGGLGVHVTLDLAGAARFGPDVAWIEDVRYGFDEGRAEAFYRAIRTYYPKLAEGSLAPGYVGVRPKLSGPGMPAADFRIDGPEAHGVGGLVQLFGIESPGLTACLAIAEEVASRIGA